MNVSSNSGWSPLSVCREHFRPGIAARLLIGGGVSLSAVLKSLAGCVVTPEEPPVARLGTAPGQEVSNGVRAGLWWPNASAR